MDANGNPDPDHVPPIDPAFVAKLNELRNTKWYSDIVTRAAAKRVLGHLKPLGPKPPFPGKQPAIPDISVPTEYPDWVLDALAASDGDPDEWGFGVLPVRAVTDEDHHPPSQPQWNPLLPNPYTGTVPGSVTISSVSNGANGFAQSYPATWTGSQHTHTGIDPANGSPAIGSSGQITLFTNEIPPRGQPYPFGHQHPHVHFRTVAAPPGPPGGATYSHSHFHRHGGRISDHEDYNIDQHSHPH